MPKTPVKDQIGLLISIPLGRAENGGLHLIAYGAFSSRLLSFFLFLNYVV